MYTYTHSLCFLYFFSQYGINSTTMIGWWEIDVPVKVAIISHASNCTNSSYDGNSILATVFTTFEKIALIAIASWCSENCSVSLEIDWAVLGLSPTSTIAYSPLIPNMQIDGPVFLNRIELTPNGGTIVVLQPE